MGVISIAELDMYRAWQIKRETLSPCYTKRLDGRLLVPTAFAR
ncbi:DUF4113 domain-containing protein [Cronobacter turicensis]|uniref:DUF4113 domain-containing protein n=1 Tax=Cronobacter turicensis TaxID=413502 RepID=A0ACD5IMX8_9ENTR